jgi:Leucine-rich repeat (LRR) protein
LSIFPFLRRSIFLTLLKGISSEYYEFNYFKGVARFPDTIATKQETAKHLFCNKSSEPKPNMDFLIHLPNLETIDARSCGISKINYDIHIIDGAESLYLNRLHRADFSHNKIESIERYCFNSLQNGLKTLNLSNNIITKFAEGAFYTLKKLEILDLSNNKISSFNFNSFNDLDQLKAFYFANNRLRVLHFELFFKSLHLQMMNFSSNRIEKITCGSSVWRYLNTLDFSENKILQMDTDIKSKCFPNLKNFIFTSTPLSLPNQTNDYDSELSSLTQESETLSAHQTMEDERNAKDSVMDFINTNILPFLVVVACLSSFYFSFKRP